MIQDLIPQPLQEASFTPNLPWLLIQLTDLDDACQKRLVRELQATISRELWKHHQYYFGNEIYHSIDPKDI
jgi:hypothetical protein